jgi:hypothetical protein
MTRRRNRIETKALPIRIIFVGVLCAIGFAPAAFAQAGWTLYAPGAEPVSRRFVIYGPASSVVRVEGEAKTLGWSVIDDATSSTGNAIAIVQAPSDLLHQQSFFDAATKAGLSISQLFEPARGDAHGK